MTNRSETDTFDYDYIVIGSGFGGSVSALRPAQKMKGVPQSLLQEVLLNTSSTALNEYVMSRIPEKNEPQRATKKRKVKS